MEMKPNGMQRITEELARMRETEAPCVQGRIEVLGLAAWGYRDATGEDSPQPETWPTAAGPWSPSTRLRNLERAGALYLAAQELAERCFDFERRDFFQGQSYTCALLIESILKAEESAGVA